MVKKLVLIFVFTTVGQVAFSQKITVDQYINTYKEIAMDEMRQHKIPASITLAQGILESGNGNSRLAKEGNNHFGIKCKKDWTGKTIIENDDEENECFRAYDKAEDSYRDHSLFLVTGKRYAFLFQLPITDFSGWANGLKQAGYATNPRYPELLLSLINRYNLAQYDSLVVFGPKPVPIVVEPAKPKIEVVDNNVPLVVAKSGQTIDEIAKEHNMAAWQLYKYNDLPKGATINPGDVIYLKPKRKKASVPNHTVGKEESMYEISQRYGIKLKHLYKKNNMEAGTEPAPGQELNLQKKRKGVPDTTFAVSMPVVKPTPTVKPATDTIQKPTPILNNVADTLKKSPEKDSIVLMSDDKRIVHKVQSGETLLSVATKYNVLMEQIRRWNGLETDNLEVGSYLIIYRTTEIPVETKNPPTHIVQAGETLYSIARKYNLTVEQLISWNKITDNAIKIGQVIKLSE